MIDKPGRAAPRFPPSKEAAVARAIRTILQQQIAASGINNLIGIAAAACGGDTLFHEACEEWHIPSEIFLGISVDAFEKTSVAFAGPEWVGRYRKLVRQLPVHILHPQGHADAPDTIWEEANQWMLQEALKNGGANMTLIALWDGKKTADRGGVEHMVTIAGAHQAAVAIIDINRL
jgi:hypothetical protein